MNQPSETLHIQIEHHMGHEEGDDDVGHPYYVAHSDSIGLVTEGDTFEELLANLQEALDACLLEADTTALYNLLPEARMLLHLEIPKSKLSQITPSHNSASLRPTHL